MACAEGVSRVLKLPLGQAVKGLNKMTICSSAQVSGEVTISIKGRFDFNTHQEFREAYEEAPGDPTAYIIDMRDATYMDSSALGMLLLLRDHAGGDDSRVEIVNCNADLKKILTVSNFGQLFIIT